MIAIGSRESIVKNLEDAGCEPGMIEDLTPAAVAKCACKHARLARCPRE